MTDANVWDSYRHRTTTMKAGDSNAWHRHSYPVQSSPKELPPGSQDAYLEAERTKTSSQQVPKYIRAVKDAENWKRTGRTIIICLDGTGDKFDADNSNIVHIVSCLKKDDPSQVTYYQSGIGTYDGGGLSNGINAAVDMAVGSGLGVHIKDAYSFLMETYKEGDKICLFGFSRGAYTCRCLAGMIHKVGLLPSKNVAQVPFAYDFYKDDTSEGWKMSAEFKKTFCIDVHIHFMGVFDCVASVGFVPRKLPFSSTPTSKTGHFRHAMALDEHRAKFKCCHWQRKDKKDYANAPIYKPAHWKSDKSNGQSNGHINGSLTNGKHSKTSPLTEKEKFDLFEPPESEHERAMRLADTHETDVLEVWFMGAHADVGGGAVKNEERHKLSQIPLRWMLRQTFECDTGIIFSTAALADVGLDVHTLYPLYSRLGKPVVGPSPSMMEKYEQGNLGPIARRSTALEPIDEKKDGLYEMKVRDDEPENPSPATEHWVPEQVEDYFDAMQIINDQLVQAKGWWVLEYWPIKYRVQKKDNDDWEKKLGFNRGRGRAVQETEPNLHWTVRHRMHNMGYKWKSRVDRTAVWRICV